MTSLVTVQSVCEAMTTTPGGNAGLSTGEIVGIAVGSFVACAAVFVIALGVASR